MNASIILGISFPVADPTWIFFIVLVMILFAPIIFERLKIPHIIGMILAGVLVGEHGLGILARDSSFELFGKVGIYYIMFLAGLEMNMEGFKRIRVKATVLGLLTFAIPMTIGIAVNTTLLGYALAASVLLACMYASHTLIAYPIVTRYGVRRQRSVSIAVGATAVTDTLTLLTLAMVSGMYKGDLPKFFLLWMILKVGILSAVIVFGLPRLGRWFFRRYSDNVVQYIFVLAMVFLGAGLMELIGMEGILGAFVVGLVLNRLIPHVSPLMSHLEFVGNALFIPYFLIGVGMMINLNVLFGHLNSLKVAGVMIAVAITAKWLAAWLTQRIFKMRSVERKMMFGLSNARAAATLAAVLVGYNIILPGGERLLNEDIFNGAILMILVTCIFSSLTTEHAAKKMALGDVDIDNAESQEKDTFLIPVANPSTLDSLVNLALLISDKRRMDSLVALNVINDNNDSIKREQSGKRYLERAAQIAAGANVWLKTVIRFDMNITAGIMHTAKECDATGIIIGLHHKKSMVDSFFGNITENLLKSTYVQVMVVRLQLPLNTIRRIIVAVPPKAEFEPGFLKWINHLCHIGAQLGCRVHFFAQPQTLGYIRGYVLKAHRGTRSAYSELDDWADLLLLTGQLSFDHLLVIVSARRGSVSYNSLFERLPSQISKYFNTNSIMLLYPEQRGDPSETLTFADPHGLGETQYYDKVGLWLYKWLRKT